MRSSSIIILFVASLDSTDLISGLNYRRAFLVGTLAATHTTASLPLQLYMTTSIYVAGYTRVFTYAPMLCFISKFYNARWHNQADIYKYFTYFADQTHRMDDPTCVRDSLAG